ncbi:cytidylyltransferase domain-containing protein [Kiloniella litopenaei]|uniref:cytidylyltransferase domain-containing protein n=1 Tax=Kiloniella litopenaei TaxID=1549748 RepID=UPI003BAB662F
MSRVIASIEARMGASRLPGKVLMDIAGRPALGHMVERIRRSQKIDDLIIATTDSSNDDPIAEWARKNDIHVFRGSEEDVLDRVVQAHRTLKTDIVVELCGDCPLISPQVLDLGVETFLQNDCDVVSTIRHESYPNGIDVQVFRFTALEKIAETITDPTVREHVSLYFYENPEIYNVINLVAPSAWKRPDYRLVLDYPEDLELLRGIYRDLGRELGRTDFDLEDLIPYLDNHPDLLEINSSCEEKSVRP